MQTKSERRFISAPHVRSQETAGKRILSGLAARFNVLSEDLCGWRERLAPGCFRASLASGQDVKLLADHDSAKILGRLQNRTLSVWESSEGLAFRCELPDTTVAGDVFALCQRGDLTECSFGFRCTDQSWGQEQDPEDRKQIINVRTVRAATVFELSCVAFPAYPETSISVDAAARALFPEGVPMEVRSRFPAPKPLSAEEIALRVHARSRAEILLPGGIQADDDRQRLLRRASVLREEFGF
jgi:hypothetical protein